MTGVGFRIRSCIVWDKLDHGMGDTATTYGPQYELILFGAKGRHLLRPPRPKDVIRVQKLLHGIEHPYQKPVELIDHLLRASSDKGQTVLDGFMGSGSTGVAAQKLGRRFIGCEIDPAYHAIATRRIEAAAAQSTFNLTTEAVSA